MNWLVNRSMKTHKLTKDNFSVTDFDDFYSQYMAVFKNYQNGLSVGSNLIMIGGKEKMEIVDIKNGYIEIKMQSKE